MFSAARWPTIEFADVVGSSTAYIYIHVYNKAAAACVVGFVSKNERMDMEKKKCCLAKGVDVIKTAATNCSFVLYISCI